MSDGGSELLRPAPLVTWRDRVALARAWVTERPWSLAAVVVAAVGVALVAVVVLRPPAVAAPPPEVVLPRAGAGSGDGSPPTTVSADVVVHVAGAVARPGLVHLATGARVADAVDAAGGLRPDADLDRLNLAALVGDGQRVWVPVTGEEPPAEVAPDGGGAGSAGSAGSAGASPDALLDLNTATAADLESLPGVGPATAQAILDHRRRVGRFSAVDELLEVRGIGPAKLAALRDRVRV